VGEVVSASVVGRFRVSTWRFLGPERGVAQPSVVPGGTVVLTGLSPALDPTRHLWPNVSAR